MNLVIVESPTKAKTLTRYLGEGYVVEATMGHVRDLPQKKIGISIRPPSPSASEGWHFVPEYVQTERQKKRTDEIKYLSDKASQIYLATDPDREGEAIAFHVAELLNSKKQETRYKRIVFHEITQHAIEEAIKTPRGIDMPLVEAQQARRVLDRLVGYKLSPLLWKKVRRGLSAGRVQSVTVKLVVEREREIEKFIPEEYWNILVDVQKIQNSRFRIQLTDKVTNGEQAEKVEKDLRGA